MKKFIALIFMVIFAWGIYSIFDRGDDDMKKVGEVNIVSTIDGESKMCSLKGIKHSKRYKDDITEFEVPELKDMADTLITIMKPEKIDEQNYIGVKYKGDYIDEEEHDMTYMVYDSNFELMYEAKDFMMFFEKGKEYYVVTDVKWGRPKNYICMRYCFKMTT